MHARTHARARTHTHKHAHQPVPPPTRDATTAHTHAHARTATDPHGWVRARHRFALRKCAPLPVGLSCPVDCAGTPAVIEAVLAARAAVEVNQDLNACLGAPASARERSVGLCQNSEFGSFRSRDGEVEKGRGGWGDGDRMGRGRLGRDGG